MHCRLYASVALAVLMTAAGEPAAYSATAYAITSENLFITFNTNLTSITTPGVISGLDTGETVAGIDIRPATGVIYLLTRNFLGGGKLYTLNPNNGAATFVAFLSQNLTGILQGIDFDPVSDRLRVISSDGQSVRVNPTTGEVIVDSPVAYAPADPNSGAPPTIISAAYSNNFAAAATASLYAMDNGTDALVRVDPANGGVLHTVGALGVDLGGPVAFDVAPSPVNHAYAAISAGFQETDFYLIDLETGHASRIGEIGASLEIRAFTVAGGYPQTAFSRSQTIRINSSGTGHQVLNYNYDTGQLSVSPYNDTTASVARFFPFVEWTGAFLYDYASGRFTQAVYSSQDPL